MNNKTDFLQQIGDTVVQAESFQNIMADKIVTTDELQEQSQRVIDLLKEVEHRFNEDDLALIMKLFAETNVLSAVYHYYELQNLKYYGNI